MIKVLVVDDRNEAHLVRRMFANEQWECVTDLYDADIVCFVGGSDVSPNIYGQHVHRTTHTNQERDSHEIEIYNLALAMGIPMVGICRGGQLLNVMNGGDMYQDVDNHNLGHHNAWIPHSTKPYLVSSVHHQMMIPNYDVEHEVLLATNQAFSRKRMSPLRDDMSFEIVQYAPKSHNTDVEALFYPDTRCLCFQPHPEYSGEKNITTKELFFEFIDTWILGEMQFTADEQAKEAANV